MLRFCLVTLMAFLGVILSNAYSQEAYARIAALAFSTDGHLYATGHADGSVRVRDVATDELLVTSERPEWPILDDDTEIYASYLAFSPDSTRLAISFTSDFWSRVGLVRVLDVTTGLVIGESFFADISNEVTWHPDSSQFAALGNIGLGSGATTDIYLFDSEGQPLFSVDAPGNSILGLEWSPDGTRIAKTTGAAVRIWDTATWESIAWTPYQPIVYGLEEWIPHSLIIHDVAWNADGSRLATTDRHTIRIWDAKTGKPQAAFHKASSGEGLFYIAWSPDGKHVASTSEDRIEVWNVETGELVSTLDSGYAYDLDWRADGMLFYIHDGIQSFNPNLTQSE